MTRFRSETRRGARAAMPAAAALALVPTVVLTVVPSVVLSALLFAAPAQAAPQVGDRIALVACPHAGVTTGCLTVSGADGSIYNITGATPKPPLNGRMIRLRATVSDKLSACLQGTVLDRVRWTPVRQKCTN